jgi:DNA-binding HxlR family transcriptional regulator
MEDGTQIIRGNTCDTEPAREVRRTMAMVGDKWSLMAVQVLRERRQPQRFSQLKRDMHGVSQRMLSRSLRHLEREGLVERTVYPTTPPTVEYGLTPAGTALTEAIRPLMEWSLANLEQAIAARERYDRRALVVASRTGEG